MTSSQQASKHDALEELRSSTPSWGLTHLDAAIAGNPKAAASLCVAMDGSARGYFAVLLGLEQALPVPAYRAFLDNAWSHDHQHVMSTALISVETYALEPNEILDDCFTYAAFALPELPEEVTIYRGTFGLQPEDAEEGISWTLSRDVGEWFARREPFRDVFPHENYDKANGPVLIKGKAWRNHLRYFTNDREEQEVVCFWVRDVEQVPLT